MINHYSVAIPTNPYLKAFITRFYGDPIRIDNKSLVGVFLIGVMSKEKFSTCLPYNDRDVRYKFFTDKIQCIAPVASMAIYGYYLSDHQVIQVNRYFEQLFEEQLFFYVQRNVDTTKRYSGYEIAIENFASFYGIELNDHVSYDCLRKIEYRYRKRLQAPAKSNNSVSVLREKRFFKGLSPREQPQQSLF
jgi:hypothetical protein